MNKEIKKGIVYIKPVYYNPAYKVDEEGIIYSKRNGEPMHPKIDQGYKRVWLLDDNGKLTPYYSVHRCVGMTFF